MYFLFSFVNILYMIYDVIIIGAGVAGLYAAYTIKRLSPNTTFLILEKNSKRDGLGGRAGNEMFCGTEVVTGAGIGRRKKDKLLYRLLKDLSMETREFTVEPHYSQTIDMRDIPKIMEDLKTHLRQKKDSEKSETFKSFATNILGAKEYNQFVITSGYTDYENEDVHDVLYHYGMDDNAKRYTGFHVAWKEMVLKMAETIGSEHIRFSYHVAAISKFETFEIHKASSDHFYSAKKVIVATTISGIRTLLPDFRIYKGIDGQPFLRVYGKFDKKSTTIMNQFVKGTTIVPGHLQKIIPIDSDKGIYMIAYSDNKHALYLKTHLENNEQNRHFFCRILEQSLGIPRDSLKLITMKPIYWDIGTHYYKPLDKRFHKTRMEFIDDAQHPVKDVLVVGEVVSLQQGWTEGALESVQATVTKKWLSH